MFFCHGRAPEGGSTVVVVALHARRRVEMGIRSRSIWCVPTWGILGR